MFLVGVGELELGEDAVDVLFDGVLADTERPGDALLLLPLCRQREDFALALAQGVEGVVVAPGPVDELGDDGGVENGAALGDSADARGELVEGGEAVLEQVADAFGAVLDQLEGVAWLEVLGEDDDADARPAGADLARRVVMRCGVGQVTAIASTSTIISGRASAVTPTAVEAGCDPVKNSSLMRV